MQHTDQTCLVLGLGASGLAMAKWQSDQGFNLIVVDSRPEPPCLKELFAYSPEAVFIHDDKFDPANISSIFSSLCVSPGIAPVQYASLREYCLKHSIPIQSELELFAQGLQKLERSSAYLPKVIAITGTNGKTTVTSMVGEMISASKRSVRVCGNIGPNMLDELAESIREESLPEYWVLELSSFQLHDSETFNPHAAVVLNVTQDHLDWHTSMEEYRSDKEKIFGPNTIRVINLLDPVGWVPSKPTVFYGTGAPKDVNQFGLVEDGGLDWLSFATDDQMLGQVPNKRLSRKAQDDEPYIQKLLPVDALKVHGIHNVSNALAALALAKSAQLPLASCLRSLREYSGQAHRLAYLGEYGGRNYYDDSKATNVGASVAAISSLGLIQDRKASKLVLIMGGDGKGQEFFPLIDPLKRYARAVILLGKDKHLLADTLRNTINFFVVNDMQEAVAMAVNVSQEGDAILLSPACASLDMYKNYEHRAYDFIGAVAKLCDPEFATLNP